MLYFIDVDRGLGVGVGGGARQRKCRSDGSNPSRTLAVEGVTTKTFKRGAICATSNSRESSEAGKRTMCDVEIRATNTLTDADM